MRAKVLGEGDFPPAGVERFGPPGLSWISAMTEAVVEESLRTGEIGMDAASLLVMHEIRDFMFEEVYLRPEVEPQRRRARQIVRDLVEYFLANPAEIPESYLHENADTATQVIDYVAGMTDRYAIRMHRELFEPRLFD